MKFSCTQENLHQGLNIVGHIASKNINLPILSNVLIKSENNLLKFISTNLEIAISCVVRGKIEANGEFTVPSKLFSDYTSLLPRDRVDIALEGNTLQVACGAYQTKMHGTIASEFPLIPTLETSSKVTVNVADLRKAIGSVLFAVSTNESRPEISGVLFKFSPVGEKLVLFLAATDSYRLAERSIPVVGSENVNDKEGFSVIVPSRTVSELVRILGVFRDDVELPKVIDIFFAENQILFSYNSVDLISRVIEGKYPDYRQLIPAQFKTEAVVAKADLLRAVKTTSLFSRTGLNDVHLAFSPEKKISVTASNVQTGEQTVDMGGEVKGADNTITVNHKYFLDGAQNIDTNDVVVQLNDSLSPCLVRPAGEGTPEYLYIVMPIRQ